ncbi:MAG TPA: methylmalonyl Co-A mutase-associated GTPase MeaB [Thermoplasmata archaeon]|nr:methylmalonyl Co-A mutase-associated GTPase MeaB [Thermoplasmata archaeon]
MAKDADRLLERALAREPRALGRLITLVESGRGHELMKKIHRKSGHAHVTGFTGPPGAGKSSLIGLIAKDLAERGKKVGVIAIDPSSPFSGGAFLGDRVRMADASADERVFIRSLGTRGHHGVLSAHTADIARILDAAGFDEILIETVGAGQADVEIMRLSHTVVVLSVPGAGDDIQFAKAGILEIGAVFVVNKCDTEGWDAVFRDIELELGGRAKRGETLFKTSAKTGEGVKELVDGLMGREAALRKSCRFHELRRGALETRARDLLHSRLGEKASEWMSAAGADLLNKGHSPEEVAEKGTEEVLGNRGAKKRDPKKEARRKRK